MLTEQATKNALTQEYLKNSMHSLTWTELTAGTQSDILQEIQSNLLFQCIIHINYCIRGIYICAKSHMHLHNVSYNFELSNVS